MALYDVIMLVVLIGAIAFGYWKGLAWQVASLAAIVVSYIVAVKFREPVSQLITAEEPWNRIAAMLILFLGSSLVIWTIYATVSKSLKKMELKGFDRQAGALLGAIKGAILCMVITMFSVSLLGEKAHDAIHNSRSGRYVVTGITKLSKIVPPELAKYTDPHVQNFQQLIGQSGLSDDGSSVIPPIFNQFQISGQNTQNPATVPSYKGQWQTPSQNQGTFQNNGFQVPIGGGWNLSAQPSGYQQPTSNQPQNNGGFFSNSNNTGGNSAETFSNGWPDVQNQARELYNSTTDAALEAARRAASDAARRAFETGDQN